MMSNEFNVDNNNNDGNASCRLNPVNNRCCSPTVTLPIDLTGHHKDPHLAKSTSKKEKGSDSLSCSLDATKTTVVKNFNPLKESNVVNECKRGADDTIFELESSPDELEEISSSSEKEENKPDQAKSAQRLRLLTKQNSVRGILKYPPGWRRRAISESSALVGFSTGSVSDDSAFFGTSLDSPDILFEFDDDEDIEEGEEGDGQDKPRKSVTFSEKMTTLFVFRPNSSILGRRIKNQKKAARRREKKFRDSQENLDVNSEPVNFKDEVEAAKHYISNQQCSVVYVDFYDSGSSGCELTDCSSTSASECSGDEDSGEVPTPAESLTSYVDEGSKDGGSAQQNGKSKRKNRRNRNRKNKQTVRTALETGGYDSD